MNNENINLNQNGLSQDELAHYGILGMKWGVRRTEAQLDKLAGRVEKLKAKKKQQDKLNRAKSKLEKLKEEEKNLKSALKNKSSKPKKEKEVKEEDSKPVKKKVKKKLSELTDEELNAAINRINLEKRYMELVSPKAPEKEQKKIFDGRNFMSKLTQQTAEDLGVQVTKHYGAKLINKLIGEQAVYANNKKKA